jgi:tetratricopeptide (TPR) repeat protein
MQRGLARRVTSVSAVGVAEQQRGYLWTSQQKSTQFPYQYVVPSSKADGSFRSLLRSSYRRPAASVVTKSPVETEEVSWTGAEGKESTGADVLAVSTRATEVLHVDGGTPQQRPAVKRDYVPLGEVVKIELRGDYLAEAGLGQEALEHYGVAMACYEAAYPEHHNQIAKMRIKVARALRMTGRPKSAVACAQHAISVLENVERPEVENVCEALLELGEAQLAAGNAKEAGTVFEDCVTIMNSNHDIGASHRGLRQNIRNARRLHMAMAQKFMYYSPYAFDRVFSLVDTALTQAERCYESVGDRDGVIRVLTARSHMNDRKYFNMRDYSGKMRKLRGGVIRRGRFISARPSASEILAFTPTVHQPYFDYAALSTAPLGKEDLVTVGPNAKLIDEGDPTRFLVQEEKKRDRDRNIVNEQIQKRWNQSRDVTK